MILLDSSDIEEDPVLWEEGRERKTNRERDQITSV